MKKLIFQVGFFAAIAMSFAVAAYSINEMWGVYQGFFKDGTIPSLNELLTQIGMLVAAIVLKFVAELSLRASMTEEERIEYESDRIIVRRHIAGFMGR